ncbi:MAG: phosphoribosylamine--glycine ligase [Candidatus Sumerlaeia bacterium]|nr:phosphoribosylamine--glycine ligase [Candidatus Sumerlaeia bacterium]
MKILIIGSGGREHCLGWKLAQSPKLQKLYFTGTNAGLEAIAEPVNIKPEPPFTELINWVKTHHIDLTVVGPEEPLAKGITDAFETAGLRIFGVNRAAAQLEASKVFAKQLMMEYGIPTAKAEFFDNTAEALAFLQQVNFPVVIKAEGLAAGKGVTICENFAVAEKVVRQNLEHRIFGDASRRILIEEFLHGEEASVLAFVDGTTILPMIAAQDHKPVFDNDRGPNTGGMGAYAPTPLVNSQLAEKIKEQILIPAVYALASLGIKYKGVLYAGLMISGEEAKVLEFNCRFGDPETQVILPLLKTDLVDIICAVIEERLAEINLEWQAGYAVCVIMASGGYPGNYEKGKLITGLEEIPQTNDVIIFHAGTRRENSKIYTNGGRVLGLTTVANTLLSAINRNYELLPYIHFDGCHYRRDIGRKALKFLSSER